jgi:PAT family acetyl-CoA transporter-like MFS transporter 1
LIFLMATQDIAVDGWALELLNKVNIGYASTCQTIGLNFGFFMSYTIFLALNSPEFCNSYLRTVPSNEGIVSLGGYLSFWGIVYIAFTIALALFKREKPTLDNNHQLDIIGTYKEIISIIKSKGKFSCFISPNRKLIALICYQICAPLSLYC